MAKTTKKRTPEEGQADTELVRKKFASRKTVAKKAGVESTTTGRKVSTNNAWAKRQPVSRKAVAIRVATGRKIASKKEAAPAAVIRGQITGAERQQLISETAYLRAESQGFLGDQREDWLRAEADVDSLLTRAGVVVSD